MNRESINPNSPEKNTLRPKADTKTGSEQVTIAISDDGSVTKSPGGGPGAGASPAVWANAIREPAPAPDWSPVMQLKTIAIRLGLPYKDTRDVMAIAAKGGYRIRRLAKQSYQIDLSTLGPTLRRAIAG
jgi:hypothetical protein